MHISETPHGLVLSYPWWIGLALGLMAVALAVYGIRRRTRIPRLWPVTLAVVFAVWAGVYVSTFKTTVTDESGSVYAFLRYDHTVGWKDAADIYLEHRGGDWQIVVIDRQRRPYRFDVAELSAEDRDRVMAYMVDRMPAQAFAPAPELLKRRSAEGARPAGWFGDQQI
jgi:hypothetical protein